MAVVKPVTYTPQIGLRLTCDVCREPSRRNVVYGEPNRAATLCEDCIGHGRLALRVGKMVTRHVSTDKRRPGGHLRRVK